MDNLTKSQQLSILPQQVHELKESVKATDSRVIDLVGSVGGLTVSTNILKEGIDKSNRSIEKLCDMIDAHYVRNDKRIKSLEFWRKGATVISSIFGGAMSFVLLYYIDNIKRIISLVIKGSPLILLMVSGCANVYSTRMIFKNEESTLILDMPKEFEAKKLKVIYDSQQGKIEITSDSWISKNQGTIDSQSGREKAFLEGSAVLVEKATEGAVRGAMKGAMPIP